MMKKSRKSLCFTGCDKMCRLVVIFLVCAFCIWLFGATIEYIICSEQSLSEDQTGNNGLPNLGSSSNQTLQNSSIVNDDSPILTNTGNSYSIPEEIDKSSESQNTNQTVVLSDKSKQQQQQQCIIWGYQINHSPRPNPVQIAIGLIVFLIVTLIVFMAMFLKRCSSHSKKQKNNHITKGPSGIYDLGTETFIDIFPDDDLEMGVKLSTLSGNSKKR